MKNENFTRFFFIKTKINFLFKNLRTPRFVLIQRYNICVLAFSNILKFTDNNIKLNQINSLFHKQKDTKRYIDVGHSTIYDHRLKTKTKITKLKLI